MPTCFTSNTNDTGASTKTRLNDDIQSERSIGAQSGNAIEKSASNSTDDCSMQTKFKLMEVRIVLDRCDSSREKGEHSMNNGNGLMVETKDEFKSNAPLKNEIDDMDEDEEEPLSLITFDPSQENGSSKQPSRSESNVLNNRCKRSGGKRFKCQHCESSFQFKCHLMRHQRMHANEKLVGIRADSNGLYRCTLCVRKFTDVSHLSIHMKMHNDNQYLYYCTHCMCPFVHEAEKDRHEHFECHFECHLCKVFVTASKNHMQDHVRTHSGATPFQCTVCHKSFKSKHGIRYHLDFVHSRNSSSRFGRR